MSNRIKHPAAWRFFTENARNITGEPDLAHLGNYRIPIPNESGDFLYTQTVEELWYKFIDMWYDYRPTSEHLYNQIQYIVNNLNH